MRADEDVADFHGGEAFFCEVGEGVEVAFGFGHFPAIDEEVGGVEPMLGEVATAGALALGDFVFVVGEDEVFAAGVEVEGVAEVFFDHGGALEVPAGAAISPWGFPEVFAVFFAVCFPEDEVGNTIFLVFVGGISSGGLGFAEVELALVEA